MKSIVRLLIEQKKKYAKRSVNLTRNLYRKKIPEISSMCHTLIRYCLVPELPSPFVPNILPKISDTCPVRCPFLFRPIVKRPAMTGSRLGRLRETGQPPGFGGVGPGPGNFRATRADVPLFLESLTRKLYKKKIPEMTPSCPGCPVGESPGPFRYRSLSQKVYQVHFFAPKNAGTGQIC